MHLPNDKFGLTSHSRHNLQDQRDAALQALDVMQSETKESHLRANRLSSNFDAVEHELAELRAQRNAAIEQVPCARMPCRSRALLSPNSSSRRPRNRM